MCRSLKRSRKLWNLIVYKGLKGKKIVVSEATTSKESISTSFLQLALFLSNFLFRYLLLHLHLTKLSRIDCPYTNPKAFLFYSVHFKENYVRFCSNYNTPCLPLFSNAHSALRQPQLSCCVDVT